MTCQEIESRAIAYMDGRLPSHERKAMEQHFQDCPACAEQMQGFAQVSDLLGEWRDIQPSAGFQARLEQRIQETAPASWWESFWSRLLPVPAPSPAFATVFLVVLLVSALLVRYSPAPVETFERQQPAATASAGSQGVDEITLSQNLALLEDWEVVTNFEVLQELKR
ncbi:MAG: zf-HC2 domain-containing protein [Acidobacteria bacterium]|nr:zf-HC2 domain-containing protein [Acidobacteriota bacterium]